MKKEKCIDFCWTKLYKTTNLKYIKVYIKKTVCYLYGIEQFIGRFFDSNFGPIISDERKLAS